MSQIDTAFIKQFDDKVTHLAQQGGSKLRSTVMIDSIGGEEKFYEQLDVSVLTPVLDRHGNTVVTDPDHQRRRVVSNPFEGARYKDKIDQARILIEADGNYAKSLGMGAARKTDQIIIDQFDAVATGGKTGSTNFSPLAANTVAVNFGGASIGMTVEKVIEANTLLLDQGVDPDMEEFHIACTSRQLADMLKITQPTSADFSDIKALMTGKLNFWMGFNWHIFGRNANRVATLPIDIATDIRSCFAWAKTGMLLAIASEAVTTIDRIPERRNTNLIQTQMDMGATRMEEEKVVKVLADESP